MDVLERMCEADARLHILPLERILLSKRTAARPKDEPGVSQIELALKILNELREEE